MVHECTSRSFALVCSLERFTGAACYWSNFSLDREVLFWEGRVYWKCKMPGCKQPIATRVWRIIISSLVIRSYLYCASSILLPVYHLPFVLQVKIAILQYLQGLIGLMDPSDFTNSGGILFQRFVIHAIKHDLSGTIINFTSILLNNYSDLAPGLRKLGRQ